MASIKLTDKTVAALSTTETQAYFWDVETQGLGVVVGRTGAKTFVARAWVNGKRRRVVIGRAGEPRSDGAPWNVRLARAAALKLLGTMADGVDPNAGKRKNSVPSITGPTLREGLTLHVANMKAGKNRRRKVCSPRSIDKMETEVPRHLGAWLDKPIVALTALELQKVCDKIERETVGRADAVNKPGVAQANKIIAHVSALWNALDKLHDLPGKNPATRLSLSALKPRDARINDDSFVAWYAKVSGMTNHVRRDLQLVSLFTGIRSEGVRNLRWEDVDTERDLLHVRLAKGDKPYTLPLVETVKAILEKRRAGNAIEFERLGGDAGWCFPSLSRDLKTVQGVAEVKERRTDKTQVDEDGNAKRISYLPGIHANRRTFNSVAIEIGIPPEARLALMNHEGKGVNVKHYGAPQTWDYIRECATKIETALWTRLEPAPVRPDNARARKANRGRGGSGKSGSLAGSGRATR